VIASCRNAVQVDAAVLERFKMRPVANVRHMDAGSSRSLRGRENRELSFGTPVTKTGDAVENIY
jgi:hypothetical protein